MIHVDHAPGNAPTVAEPESDSPAWPSAKLAKWLLPGDAMGVSFAGFGTLIMKVDARYYSRDDDPELTVRLSAPDGTGITEFLDATKPVVIQNPALIGQWR